MIIVLIVLMILCWLMMYSLVNVAARADRTLDQLMFESQTEMGGGSNVG